MDCPIYRYRGIQITIGKEELKAAKVETNQNWIFLTNQVLNEQGQWWMNQVSFMEGGKRNSTLIILGKELKLETNQDIDFLQTKNLKELGFGSC